MMDDERRIVQSLRCAALYCSSLYASTGLHELQRPQGPGIQLLDHSPAT